MNLNTYATEISLSTGKDRGNCYKALKTLLAKIEQDDITSLSYNLDFTEVTINDVRFIQDARKHWKQSNVHQQKPVVKTVEEKPYTATQVEDVRVNTESNALAASMMCIVTHSDKPVETPKPFYFDDVLLSPSGRPMLDENGNPYRGNLPPVIHAPDSCVNEPAKFDTSKCVHTADEYKKQLISLFIANGHSEEDAEINANAHLNSFSVKHDPDLSGTYEKVNDDSFLFNGKTVKFDEEDKEWK